MISVMATGRIILLGGQEVNCSGLQRNHCYIPRVLFQRGYDVAWIPNNQLTKSSMDPVRRFDIVEAEIRESASEVTPIFVPRRSAERITELDEVVTVLGCSE